MRRQLASNFEKGVSVFDWILDGIAKSFRLCDPTLGSEVASHFGKRAVPEVFVVNSRNVL